MFEYTCMKPEIRENFESEPLSSMNDHLDTRVDLNDLMRKVKDEEELRSLIGINNGRKNMREALGMSLQTPTKEAIRNFWLLGEFLALGEGVKNKKLNKDLKERQKLLEAYKVQIANLKKKLKDDTEDEDDKTIE